MSENGPKEVDPGFVYEITCKVSGKWIQVGYVFRTLDGGLECWAMNSAWESGLKPGGNPALKTSWRPGEIKIAPIGSRTVPPPTGFPTGDNNSDQRNSFFVMYSAGVGGMHYVHTITEKKPGAVFD